MIISHILNSFTILLVKLNWVYYPVIKILIKEYYVSTFLFLYVEFYAKILLRKWKDKD